MSIVCLQLNCLSVGLYAVEARVDFGQLGVSSSDCATTLHDYLREAQVRGQLQMLIIQVITTLLGSLTPLQVLLQLAQFLLVFDRESTLSHQYSILLIL